MSLPSILTPPRDSSTVRPEVDVYYFSAGVWMKDGGGGNLPAPPATDNPPANLFTAIQEQLGLKLEAVKAPADVMVIDKAQQPSPN